MMNTAIYPVAVVIAALTQVRIKTETGTIVAWKKKVWLNREWSSCVSPSEMRYEKNIVSFFFFLPMICVAD